MSPETATASTLFVMSIMTASLRLLMISYLTSEGSWVVARLYCREAFCTATVLPEKDSAEVYWSASPARTSRPCPSSSPMLKKSLSSMLSARSSV